MHDNFDVEPEVLKAKLTAETAKIDWASLQRFYASGVLVLVHGSLDLIDVAYAFAVDDKSQVGPWIQQQHVERVSDDIATQWATSQPDLWAVVVSPWVLVQLPKQH